MSQDELMSRVHELVMDHAKGAGESILVEMVREHLSAGGKGLRAQVAYKVAVAFGAQDAPALCWAAACEALHNATLIHDDVQDGDPVRRGKPALWKTYGTAQAINAGDLLLVLPSALVAQADAEPRVLVALSKTLAAGAAAVIHGQGQELDLTEKQVVDPQHYRRVIGHKTTALFQAPAVGGAQLAQQSSGVVQSVRDAFAPLGTAFQMLDDAIDLYGEKGRRVSGNDLREGKISALVVEHLKRVPADKQELLEDLRRDREQTTDARVLHWREAFVNSGAVAAVNDDIRDQLQTFQRAVREQCAALNGVSEQLVTQLTDSLKALHVV